MYNLTAVPGKWEQVHFTTVDDRNNAVTNETVVTVKSFSPDIFIDNTSLYISNGRIKIHGKPKSSGILQLQTVNARVISTKVYVTIAECPPGMSIDKKESLATCTCS